MEYDELIDEEDSVLKKKIFISVVSIIVLCISIILVVTPKNHSYKVGIKSKDGLEITLLDNDYLVINNRNYEILEGTIDLSKFYNIFIN